MGLSSSKQTQKTDQQTQQTGTTMPVAPDWLTGAAQDYVSRIGAFGDMDPNQFIAGPSPLQQQAWGNVNQLGAGREQANLGAGLAFDTATAGPNLAGRVPGGMGTAAGPVASKMQNLTGGGFQGPAMAAKSDPMAGPQVAQGPAGQGAGVMTKTLPAHPSELPRPVGNSGLVPSGGYSAAPAIPGYAQPRPGQPIGYVPPAQDNPAITSQTAIANPYFAEPAVTGASQAGSYMNPYLDQVVDTSLAGFDRNAALREAQMEANAARNGAFGGSRYGIREGQFAADNELNRASLDAGLRSQGFNIANQFGTQDAGAMNAMNQFNASQGNQMGQFNAGSLNNMGQFNAAAGNNMLQFDASQRDNAANRALAAAGLLQQGANSYDASTRADLALMSGLGDQQRGIEQAYAGAPIMQLEGMGNLMGATPYQILTGQQVNTNGTMQGTNVTKSSPSLFNSLLSGASAASMFF